MSKYEPLLRHLSDLHSGEWRATFADVEAILGFPLPDSARQHSAWWSNNRQGSRHSAAWLDAGWRAEELSLTARRVVFRRGAAASVAPSPPPPARPRSAPIRQAPEPLPVTRVTELSLSMLWAARGTVTTDADGRLAFPAAPKTPAVYCFTVSLPGGQQRRYIGEAVDLARRFGNYRNPGPTQQTSQRINKVLLEALAAGAAVTVEAVTGGAWVDVGGRRQDADLASKVVRCLLENAAIMSTAGDVEMLNMAD